MPDCRLCGEIMDLTKRRKWDRHENYETRVYRCPRDECTGHKVTKSRVHTPLSQYE